MVASFGISMPGWIALFRGINVGGKNSLPMAVLSKELESLGCRQVKTYIQSGNVFFQSSMRSAEKLETAIADAIESRQGFRPKILLLSPIDLQQSIADNPFPSAVETPKNLHFYFLRQAPQEADLDGLKAIKKPSEQFQIRGKVFYLWTPDGFGDSKLASMAEKKLRVDATARNYRTVEALAAMMDG